MGVDKAGCAGCSGSNCSVGFCPDFGFDSMRWWEVFAFRLKRNLNFS